ncbi:MAG: DegT/DnrJ/EryC1/StrS family aminotransferase [Ruminococcus flavefaciens]|nr:DegT/DnrJ/EryC1/StrS family aminotransferase [Ruminococcus flavefaciens]
MEFRDLKKQYELNKRNIDKAIREVLDSAHFIQGSKVAELEEKLADYVGVKHCVACANGTDALQLVLMTWNIGKGDVVFVPDFTFFSSGEVVAAVGAAPVFVDVDRNTYNIDTQKLVCAIKNVLKEGKEIPKAIIAVDLFGQPANYAEIRKIASEYGLFVLEDGAQGFGGAIGEKKACSFGDISTTSFFPAKPLGCYGDGGAIFTDNEEWAQILRSLTVHGKGQSKYDNVRVGMNSRLDTMQAAILLAKLPVFIQEELPAGSRLAELYEKRLKDIVKVPVVENGYYSSWAQYTIQLAEGQDRQKLQEYLKAASIPTAVYYQKPMHRQDAFSRFTYADEEYLVTNELCERVLSLPFHPYMELMEAELIAERIEGYLK